jgi:hypothetical protein
MTKDEWLGDDYREYPESCCRMATTATHMLGDISRDNPALAFIEGETDAEYVGQFATGFGFIRVKFPKETTRKLTPAEAERFRASRLIVGSVVTDPLEIDESDVDG